MKTQAEIATMLSQHGIRPSMQRIVIMNYLMSVKSHPSADKVYEELAGNMPTLSKATVYNTLNLFTEKGVVKMITLDPNEKRFDGDIDTHAHFRCTICGSLEDVMMSDRQIKAIEFKTLHKVISTDVYLGGVCVKCQSGK